MTCNAPLKTYSPGNHGFTLVEVLVSLTIMALIAGIAFAGLSVAIDSWRKGTQKIEELDRRFALERLVQRQVSLADVQLFRGTDRELQFVSSYSFVSGPGEPVWVKYVADSGRFIYSETPLSEYTPERSESVVTETLGSFSQIGFYYLVRSSDGQPSWAREWTQEKELPPAVHVRIGDDQLTIPLANRQ
jgi:general secretion pathway protein J